MRQTPAQLEDRWPGGGRVEAARPKTPPASVGCAAIVASMTAWSAAAAPVHVLLLSALLLSPSALPSSGTMHTCRGTPPLQNGFELTLYIIKIRQKKNINLIEI